MKRLFVSALLVLGSAYVASAQETAPSESIGKGTVAQDFTSTSAAKGPLIAPPTATEALFPPAGRPVKTLEPPVVATTLAVLVESAEPADPSPQPKFLYGGRDASRWRLGFAATGLRFQSSIFWASAVGLTTSASY